MREERGFGGGLYDGRRLVFGSVEKGSVQTKSRRNLTTAEPSSLYTQ